MLNPMYLTTGISCLACARMDAVIGRTSLRTSSPLKRQCKSPAMHRSSFVGRRAPQRSSATASTTSVSMTLSHGRRTTPLPGRLSLAMLTTHTLMALVASSLPWTTSHRFILPSNALPVRRAAARQSPGLEVSRHRVLLLQLQRWRRMGAKWNGPVIISLEILFLSGEWT